MSEEQFQLLYKKLDDIHSQQVLNGYLLAGILNATGSRDLNKWVADKVKEHADIWQLLGQVDESVT